MYEEIIQSFCSAQIGAIYAFQGSIKLTQKDLMMVLFARAH
jgi:hypothetical protein